MSTAIATLKDGRTVEFFADPIGEGGMKLVYFSKDKSSVICFFKDQSTARDPNRMQRLDSILGKFNPTLDPKHGAYWKDLFCWPTGIVVKPLFGVMAPTYGRNYFFASGPFQGKEKEGTWFSRPKLRAQLPEAERGTWIHYFALCLRMARAVRRLHQAGLAHSDLSCRNVLIDPSTGQAAVIDCDSLVVPRVFPPDVLGTPGYIAPEVLETIQLRLDDPKRKHPCLDTDQHALAVLIYEYLLQRHPLRGPKINHPASAEQDEHLSMGAKALFIEDPNDRSNRPRDLKVEYTALGPVMADLFLRAFAKGLHAPHLRPAAQDLERGLVKTWDLLLPCSSASCPSRYFVLGDFSQTQAACPFCGTRFRGVVPVLKLRTQRRQGQWLQDGQLVVPGAQGLFSWHAFDNVFWGEGADRTRLAYFVIHQGQWVMVNEKLTSLTSPGGNRVPPGQAVGLTDGAQIRLSQEEHGRVAEVQLVRL